MAGMRINPTASGLAKPYLKPFRLARWCHRGDAQRLADKKDVIVLTADVSSFYHQLNPDFMSMRAFTRKQALNNSMKPRNATQPAVHRRAEHGPAAPRCKGFARGPACLSRSCECRPDRASTSSSISRSCPLYYGRYRRHPAGHAQHQQAHHQLRLQREWIINRDGGQSLLNRENGSILFKPDYRWPTAASAFERTARTSCSSSRWPWYRTGQHQRADQPTRQRTARPRLIFPIAPARSPPIC